MRLAPPLSLSLALCAAPALFSSQARAGIRAPRPPAFTFAPAAPAPSAPRAALVVRVVGRTVTVSRLSPTDRSVTPLAFTVEPDADVNRGSGSTLSLSLPTERTSRCCAPAARSCATSLRAPRRPSSAAAWPT